MCKQTFATPSVYRLLSCTRTSKTRMHSSMMCTTTSSSRHGGVSIHQPSPPGADPWEQAPPLGVGLETSHPDRPQLPPWVWAWRPPWADPPQLPPWVWAWKPARHAGIPPCCKACWDTTTPLWTEFLTHATENITLPQTSFAGGNNVYRSLHKHIHKNSKNLVFALGFAQLFLENKITKILSLLVLGLWLGIQLPLNQAKSGKFTFHITI